MNFKFIFIFFIGFGIQPVWAQVMTTVTQTFTQTPISTRSNVLPTATPTSTVVMQQLKGHVPEEIKTAPLVGDVPSDTVILLAIGLPYRDKQAVDDFTQSLYDPKSPNYRQFLNSYEIADRFGPSQEDYQKVVDFLKANGLTVTHLYDTRLLIGAEGTVDVIQKTFHVHLHNYKRTDGSLFHAPDTEPSVDLDVPLSHISGLDNHFINRPVGWQHRHGVSQPQLTPTP